MKQKKRTIKNHLDKFLEITLIILMTTDVLIVLWQVFSRFILHRPSSFTEEAARFLLIWIGLLGAAYACGQKLHLAIDILRRRLKGKRQRALEIFIQLAVFIFAFGVMVVGGARLALITLRLHQISAALRMKLGYVYLAIPLSGLLIMWYAGLFFWKELKGKKEEIPLAERPERGRLEAYPD